MDELYLSSDSESSYGGARTPKRPVRSKNVVVPVKGGRKSVSLNINVVPKSSTGGKPAARRSASPARRKASPARRRSKFVRPWAFINANFRVLTPPEGTDYLFAFDHLIDPSVMKSLLGTDPTEIGSGFLVGHVLTSDSQRTGYPCLHKVTSTKEAVNGILYQVPIGSIETLMDKLRTNDPQIGRAHV